MKKMTDKELLTWASKNVFPRREPGSLRFQARCYFLDDKKALAKEYSRRANRLEKLSRRAA